MKWYEEGNGTFENGVFVMCKYDQFVREWGNKIRNDPGEISNFLQVCLDAKMFDDVMDHQIITAEMFYHMLNQGV